MASTQITVENRTDIPISALLTWAGGHIGMADIQAAPTPEGGGGGPRTGHHRPAYPSGSIPCEYVYYDLLILDRRPGSALIRDVTGVIGGTTLVQKQARGSTSLIFERTGEQGYRLT
jgi:hypothetical protein